MSRIILDVVSPVWTFARNTLRSRARYRSVWVCKGARIGDILSAELRPYSGARTLIEGPQLLLAPKLALTMALLFHELATNAAKYWALSSPEGKISVRWSRSEGELKLEWRESEGPPVEAPNHRGFGTRLFLRALDQFGGNAEAAFCGDRPRLQIKRSAA